MHYARRRIAATAFRKFYLILIMGYVKSILKVFKWLSVGVYGKLFNFLSQNVVREKVICLFLKYRLIK